MTKDSHHGIRSEGRGIILLLISALAFSTAGFFTREAPVGPWAMIVWRNLFGCAGLALILATRPSGSSAAEWRIDRQTGAAIACSALGTAAYLTAFKYTSVANISILYATAPMMTAGLAWICLGEQMAPRTLVAACLALVGVAVTVRGSVSTGDALGDGLALLMTAALSIVAVLARSRPLPPLPTALASSLLAAAIVAPLSLLDGAGLRLQASDALWLATFGVVTMTVALPCYLAGAARVPAGKAMLISAIELPFAPFWVWLAFGEVPASASLIGGAIIVAAIMLDVRGTTKTEV